MGPLHGNDGPEVKRSKDQKIKRSKKSTNKQNWHSKEHTMMMHTTLEQLRSLRLAGMATGLQE